MFFYKVEGHMPKLSSFGRGKTIRPKKSLTSLLHAALHFTVACQVTWPLSGREAGGNLVLIQTLLLFTCNFTFYYYYYYYYVDHVVLMLTTLHLHMKSMRFVSKQGQLQPRFHS